MNLSDYGYLPNVEDFHGLPARVTAVHKERYEIVCEHGVTHARLKAKEYYCGSESFPTVGDFVAINYIPNGDSRIIATLPRRTFFSRRESYQKLKEEATSQEERLRRKREWSKGVAKANKQRKKEIW